MAPGVEEVSVVIPTYYRNDLLQDAIESVRQQTHSAKEIIVVDDSGESHAASVLDGSEDITYVPLQENQGPQAARSVGAERATGDYIQFLDDDDMLREDKFEKQLPLFSDSVGVVYSGIQLFESGEIKRPDPKKKGNVLEYALRVHLWEPACTPSLLIDYSLLEKLLPLRNRHGCDDDGLMLELAELTEFDFVDEPLVYVRKDTGYSVAEQLGGIDGRKQLLETHSDLYDQHPSNPRQYVLYDINKGIASQRLEERYWSPTAIAANAKALYYAPQDRGIQLVILLASLFGRPGIQFLKLLKRQIF